MDGGLTNTLADELAELLDLIRLDEITEDSQAKKWSQVRGYNSVKHALAAILTSLPEGTQVCLK